MGKKRTERCCGLDTPYGYTVAQNLKDAGCTEELSRQFMVLQKDGEAEKQIQLLSGHRRHLLDVLHQEERRIDCLDYLMYQIQKRDQN